ncbi:hypothetical protein B7P43_G03097 [Cryptotermes secundus]|uniref:Mos1 transposase HTH domain-containing protein n=1 Tax=Cryptotermes secundus TaxID=105785 RepID=A0A2J7RP38_9NEOP|nr:hypothetical protein B7P43_G03097 [Cryptotermes secundus]
MSCRQRAVIEFLVKEEIPAAEIHQRLQRACGSVCMGASSVRRWVKHFKDGNTSIEDEPRSGRPRTASTERNKERVDEIIQDDRRVTVDTIARKLRMGHSAEQEMIESLGYRKVCARWALRLLTEDHKGQRKAITPELLQRYRHEGDDFSLCIVTGDESWFHHFEPETKRQRGWRNLHHEKLHNLYSSPSIIIMIKSRRMRWTEHVAQMGETRNAYRILMGKPEGKRPLRRPRRRWVDNSKMDLREKEWDSVDWTDLAHDRYQWRALVNTEMNLRVP